MSMLRLGIHDTYDVQARLASTLPLHHFSAAVCASTLLSITLGAFAFRLSRSLTARVVTTRETA
jgi:hypothetical protein